MKRILKDVGVVDRISFDLGLFDFDSVVKKEESIWSGGGILSFLKWFNWSSKLW